MQFGRPHQALMADNMQSLSQYDYSICRSILVGGRTQLARAGGSKENLYFYDQISSRNVLEGIQKNVLRVSIKL